MPSARSCCGRERGTRYPFILCCADARWLGFWKTICVELELIDKTPSPVLARLNRAHDWMTSLVKMSGCVPVRGTIATADMTADQALAQMHPSGTCLEALRATLRWIRWRAERWIDLIEVSAALHCASLPQFPAACSASQMSCECQSLCNSSSSTVAFMLRVRAPSRSFSSTACRALPRNVFT